MKLWQFLEQSAASEHLARRPCVAFLDDDDDSISSSSISVRSRSLSYCDACHVYRQHKQWLERALVGNPTTNTSTVIAYLSSNTPDYLLSLLAATALDGQQVDVVLLNTRWTHTEIAQTLQQSSDNRTNRTLHHPDSNRRTLILFEDKGNFREQARRAVHGLRHVSWSLPIPTLAQERSNDASRNEQFQLTQGDAVAKGSSSITSGDNDDDEDALVVFTSGTSGGAKGVRLSHKALYLQARAKCDAPCRYNSNTHMLANTVPLFHVGGLSSVLALLLAGGTWVFPTIRRSRDTTGFDPASVFESLEPRQGTTNLSVNTLVVVPAMLHAMLHHRENTSPTDLIPVRFPNTQLILIGGQSAPPAMLEPLKLLFPNARIVQTYACTEAASSMTFLDLTKRTVYGLTCSVVDCGPSGDCVGLPPPHVELALVRQDTEGNVSLSSRMIQDPFQVGIFATKGPHIMSGYWDRDQPMASRSRVDGSWVVTNDLGFTDQEGQFYFCGRVKDVIRTGGETVVSTEVERALLQHDGIDECAVFGLLDERFGETVCAAIVMAQGVPGLTLGAVQRFCVVKGLAGYKRPRRLFRLRVLPRNASGKILKYRLVERFKDSPELSSKL